MTKKQPLFYSIKQFFKKNFPIRNKDHINIYWFILFLFIILFILSRIYNKYKEKFDDESPFLNTMFDPITNNYYQQSNKMTSRIKDVHYEKDNKNDENSKTPGGIKSESKGELICKDTVEKIFNKKFNKIRSNFLKNDVTSQNLELDMYNDELKLAIEYNGKQHYEFVPYFHKNHESFLNQRYRDEMKKVKCDKQGIKLITVPYYIKHNQIPSFIYKECRKLNLI
jgi:hypothetical protein